MRHASKTYPKPQINEALRLIPDINVLLSGVTGDKGPAVELYALARRFELVWVLYEGHFDEMTRVLGYPQVQRLGSAPLEPARAFSIAAELYRIGEYHERLERFELPSCPDRKDWYLLDLLLTSDADGIVTHDRHLLAAGERLSLDIAPPKVWRKRLSDTFPPSGA